MRGAQCRVREEPVSCANDGSARSIDRVARSMDQSLVQASVDRVTIDQGRSGIPGNMSRNIPHEFPGILLRSALNWLDCSLLGAIGNTLRLLLHHFYRINDY